MKLHELGPLPGSKQKPKRIGRGESSGTGKTSGRGHKGQKARSGGGTGPGFEGGQMPLYRRVPKSGFKNINRVEYTAINLSNLQYLVDNKNISVIDIDILRGNGLIGRNDLVKILAKGNLTAKVEVKAHAFSQKAIQLIEAQGGVATKL
jgi:large subunit ribosomal protein L15